MRFIIAKRAHLQLAARARGVFATFTVAVNLRWLDPFATFGCGTVNAVLRIVLLILSVPRHLELQIEELVYMLEGYVIVCTASWWHVRWIFDGHLEYALETVMAHSVSTSELCRIGMRHVIRATRQAFDQPWRRSRGGVGSCIATE